jgi:hypothetical protein
MIKTYLKTSAVLLVVAGLIMGGVALAQTGDDETPAAVDHPGYQHILEQLSGLVRGGVISQAQAEAVAEHLVSGEGLRPRPGRPGGHFRGGGIDLLAEAAGILNMSVEDLHDRMRGGESLADIAGGQTDALIAQLVAAIESDIEAAIDEGVITEEQRDQILRTVPDRVARFVEHVPGGGEGFHHRGPGRGPRSGPGFGGHGPGGPGFGPGPGSEASFEI